jgi:predicted nucleic acid-binding protein
MPAVKTRIVIDASVLINFLNVDRLSLLRAEPNSAWTVTEHVRDELWGGTGTQRARYGTAVAGGILSETRVDLIDELLTYAEFLKLGLGRGESATLAVAIHRNWIAALDDHTAIKKAVSLHSGIQVIRTVDIVSTAIIQGALSVEEADAMKMVWETEHRFRLTFGSFAEIVYRDRGP